ncbi:MAG: hypothetical protein AAFP90_09690 [Planctomycetota bacterium]
MKTALRIGIALLLGWLAMVIGFILYQLLIVTPLWYLNDPASFQKAWQLIGSPDEFTEAMKDGTIRGPGPTILMITLVLDCVCGITGGWVVARISGGGPDFGNESAIRRMLMAVMGFLLAISAFAVVQNLTSELEATLPAWVTWGRTLLAVPAGILVGGHIAKLQCQSKSTD